MDPQQLLLEGYDVIKTSLDNGKFKIYNNSIERSIIER